MLAVLLMFSVALVTDTGYFLHRVVLERRYQSLICFVVMIAAG